MKFEESAAKGLLKDFGIEVPRGLLVATPEAAVEAVRAIGPAMIKAQVPTGKRGKAGAIRRAETPDEAAAAATAILAMELDGWPVTRLLVEEAISVSREFYAAVMIDMQQRAPLILFAAEGGMEIEALAAKDATALRQIPLCVGQQVTPAALLPHLEGLGLDDQIEPVAQVLVQLYRAWRLMDSELLEINPLALTQDGRLLALDCKLQVDDSAAPRQGHLAALATPEPMTDLEAEAAAAGLKYIELGGSVGVLANGAGLTMTTIDAIQQFGGQACNFLEIGGDAYTKAETALEILLKHPGLKSLLVNFCGAFARTDVMAAGVVKAWQKLQPSVPVFFSIHGTGEEEAVALVERELGIAPFAEMDLAVRAAVEAAV